MKKYLIYMRRMCALLLVMTLVISQDMIPVHALSENAEGKATVETVEDETEKPVEEESVEKKPVEEDPEASEDESDEDHVMQNDPLLIVEEPEEDEQTMDESSSPYEEDGIHVNPSTVEKTDPLGTSVTVTPGNNSTGNGSLNTPYYSLGKAYASLPADTEDAKIYVHNSGVIVSGEGTDEKGSSFIEENGAINTAEYFEEDRQITVFQADDLDALFTVLGGSLTLQNMTMEIVDSSTLSDAEIRVALSGGKIILGEGLTVPADKFYFRVNETIDGTQSEESSVAPIRVEAVPTSEGDKIPVIVGEELVESYVKHTTATADKTTTEEWVVNIPIAQASNSEHLSEVSLKGIGSMGSMSYGVFGDVKLDGTVTSTSDNQTVQEWNTPLAFTMNEENDTLYLTGYHKKVTTKTVPYQGLIFVGKDSKGNTGSDENDGLTEDTPVKTLNKAKELLDYYDGLYKETYMYPKIIINKQVTVTGEQSLDFEEYETTANADFAPSSTGYRASLWCGGSLSGREYSGAPASISVSSDSKLYLGQGVNIKDVDVKGDRYDVAKLKYQKPEEVTGISWRYGIQRPFIICEATDSCINLENVKYYSEEGSVLYFHEKGSSSVEIKNCEIVASNLLVAEGSGNLNVLICGETTVNCKNDVLKWYASMNSLKINLSGNASIDDETKKPKGKGYLYSEAGAVIYSNGGPNSKEKGISIERGLLAGNGNVLLDLQSSDSQLSLYMKNDSRYCQLNENGSIIRFGRYAQNRVYYQGGEILSQGKAFMYTREEEGYDYRLILDGGKPVTQAGEALKILAEKQWTKPHIYLGKGKTEYYRNNTCNEKIELDLYNEKDTSPFSDNSKIVGKMDDSDDLDQIRPMFKLLHDNANEIYDEKTIMLLQRGKYLILGVNGIYIDGKEYNSDTGLGGRPYGTSVDETHADGSIANPVRTFWDAQRVYDAMTSDKKAKLKGIYILNCVTIGSEDDITVAGTDGEVSTVTGADEIPNRYTCNFGDLTIYDSTNVQEANNTGSTMLSIYKGGKLNLDHIVLDGSLISEVDKANRFMIHVSVNSILNMQSTKIHNLNYAVSKGAIFINNSTLNIKECEIVDTNSDSAIYCSGTSSCTIDESIITSSCNSKNDIDPVINFYSVGEIKLINSQVSSSKAKVALRCALQADCEITDSKVTSTTRAAIITSDKILWQAKKAGKMSVTGSETLIQGSYGIYFYGESSTGYSWQLDISGMAVLESTDNYNALRLNGNEVVLDVKISGAKLISSRGDVISYGSSRKSGEKDQIILNAASENYIELKTTNAGSGYAGVLMNSAMGVLGLGGDVRTDIEKGVDFNLNNSCSEIVIKEKLTGNDTYLVKTGEKYIGQTLVDCSEVSSSAQDNQSHFTLCDDSTKVYSDYGIELPASSDEKTYYPAEEDDNHLWIPYSKVIFWDWGNGDDANAEKEGGGHCPELAVKSVNGVRRMLVKDGILQIDAEANELKVTNKFTEPVKVVALSGMGVSMYGSDSHTSREFYVNPKCYGDNFSGGYRTSAASNTANVLDWKMPEPTNGQEYLIDIKPAAMLSEKSSLFAASANSHETLRLENIEFSGHMGGGVHVQWFYIGDNIQLVMSNCYINSGKANGGGWVGDSYSAIAIQNKAESFQISNVTIAGNMYCGIYSWADGLLDQVKIEEADVALVECKNTCTIRGEDSKLRGCCIQYDGRLIAEEGTIISTDYSTASNDNISYFKGAVAIDRGEYYQRGTSKVICGGTAGIGVSSRGKAYLEGGEIIGDISENSNIRGVYSDGGTIELSGTKISGCYKGISAYYKTDFTMSGGIVTDNKYGIVLENSDTMMTLSGGLISKNEYTGVTGAGGALIMTGGEICDNGILSSIGGGIQGLKDVSMTGGRISGNKGYCGGGISGCSGTVQISGGVIEDNEGSYRGEFPGGGIVQSQGTVVIEGGTITNNHAYYGSAVYVAGSASLELNGGEISGNQNRYQNTGEIYYSGTQDMKIGKKGRVYPKIEDTIYLSQKDGKIQLTAAVRGDYNVRVNERDFAKGDKVVVPNGDSVQSAASYLTHFTLFSDRYVLARKGTDLVLDGIVFVNGMADTNGDGTLPNKPRNDFETVIKDNAYNDNVIYITGAVHIKKGEDVVVTDRTIRRYTGQPINGTKYDSSIYNEPLFIIDEGGTLTLINTTVSGRMGVKSDETYNKDKGYLIENYGTLNIDVDVDAKTVSEGSTKGQHSVLADNLGSGLGIAQHGTMNMSPFSQIDQMIKLGGENVDDTDVYYGLCASDHSAKKKQSCVDTEDRIIQIYGDASGSGLQKTLNLDVDHKVKDRVVTSYTALDKDADLQAEKALHQIKALDASGYYLASDVKGDSDAGEARQKVDMILREPGIYYVDGTAGNDTNSGTTPDHAFKTMERAYHQLSMDAANPDINSRGGLIYIVSSVQLTDGLKIEQVGEASVMTAGSESYNTKGSVTIRRYSKPTNTALEGYHAASNQKTMFTIPAGRTVSMQGVTIDGHSRRLDSEKDYLAAEGVTNADAVFKVSGTLTLGSAEAAQNTLVQNNDASVKNGGLICVTAGGSLKVIGDTPKAADLEEGQSAVYGTSLSGGKALKGSAIYAGQGTSGSVALAEGAASDYPEINGTVYLTGSGADGSSYLTIADGTAGAVTDSRYDLEVQDAYNNRLVVSYLPGEELTAADVKGYTVSGRQGYDVAVNDDDKSQIILRSLGAVYIDGVNGSDANDGKAPGMAVKTLEKAYGLLQAQKGGVLYVVNTVTVTDTQSLTENSYTSYGTRIVIDEGTVQIQRYGKPTAYGTSAWTDNDSMDSFDVESNVNALFCISGNGRLNLQNILIDGHKDVVELKDALSYKTNAGAIEASAPLIQAAGGTLNLGKGAILQNNKNIVSTENVDTEAGKLPGGAVYNTGTVTVTGGIVRGNAWTGSKKEYSISTENVSVTQNASGIWQAGTLTFDISDVSDVNWDGDQYIYLDEKPYDAEASDQFAKDAKVFFLNVQSLPSDVVLPLDLNRDGTAEGKVTGWFAPGRKVVEMNRAGQVTAANFAVNGGSFVGCWLDQSDAVTEKLTLAAREGEETILELQRAADDDCIVDVIVPVKASAGTNKINNLSVNEVNASGAVNESKISARTESEVTINGELSDRNRIKISCGDGK